MNIRDATIDDLDEITRVETECFPMLEAATRESFSSRLTYFPNHFYTMWDGKKLVSFVDGFATNESDLLDIMYERADMHDENGAWFMIFGVDTLEEYRGRGYASSLVNVAISDAKRQNRLGVVLTAKQDKLSFYERLGFTNEGVSKLSTHGGATWYQMRLTF